ncbi:MAG: hypothetical protein ACRC2T_03825, partial [Thermoguttaceae bacterium]
MPHEKTTSIRFRCPRCMRDLKATQEKAGTKTRCPACFFDFNIPLESTRKDISDADLYKIDEQPIDMRELQHRVSVSFSCPVCRAILAVDSPKLVGTDIVCPDCDSVVTVPATVAALFDKSKQTGTAATYESASKPSDNVLLPSSSVSTGTVGGGTYELSGSDRKIIAQEYTSEGLEIEEDGSFSVYCDLCHTLMYATKEMIGSKITCPDCETETVVREPEKKNAEKFQAINFEGSTHYGTQAQPYSSNEKLVPVVCVLCETRMYAPESQIGQFKTCPDCGTQTEITFVPEEERILPDTSGSDYDVKQPEVTAKPTIRYGADYRNVEGSLDLIHRRENSKDTKSKKHNNKHHDEHNEHKHHDEHKEHNEHKHHDEHKEHNEHKHHDEHKEHNEHKHHDEHKDHKNSKSSHAVHSAIFVEQEPFQPHSVKGAKPDSYDLERVAPRLIPKPPPAPQIFEKDEPLELKLGPKPELVKGRDKSNEPPKEVASDVRMLHNRRIKRAEKDTAKVIYRRPSPHKNPFVSRFFRPILSPDFRQTCMTTLAIGTIPTAAMIYAGPEGYKLLASGIETRESAGAAFFFLICMVFAIVTATFWISRLANDLFTFFSATSNGDDQLDFFPDYSYPGGLLLAGRLLLVSVSAILPGYIIWFFTHLIILDLQGAELTVRTVFNPVSDPIVNEAGEITQGEMSMLFITICLVSHWLFYPIVFLSSCESEEGFVPFSSNTIRSIFLMTSLWFKFYFFSFPIAVVLACFVYSYYILGVVHETPFKNSVQYVSLLLLGTMFSIIFFRLIGRLAWVIEDSEMMKDTE